MNRKILVSWKQSVLMFFLETNWTQNWLCVDVTYLDKRNFFSKQWMKFFYLWKNFWMLILKSGCSEEIKQSIIAGRHTYSSPQHRENRNQTPIHKSTANLQQRRYVPQSCQRLNWNMWQDFVKNALGTDMKPIKSWPGRMDATWLECTKSIDKMHWLTDSTF